MTEQGSHRSLRRVPHLFSKVERPTSPVPRWISCLPIKKGLKHFSYLGLEVGVSILKTVGAAPKTSAILGKRDQYTGDLLESSLRGVSSGGNGGGNGGRVKGLGLFG